MTSDLEQLLEHYVQGVEYPPGQAAAVLELLRTRSRLAEREAELDEEQQTRLDDADGTFLRAASLLYDGVASLRSLDTVRREASVPDGHWWWRLEKFA